MLRSQGEKISGVRKIAVLRANGLGDFIFVFPAMEALRATYPDAEIILLAKNWHADFLARRPGPIDRVIIIPPTAGVGEPEGFEADPAEQERFFAAMEQERFDLAIQLHGGGRYSNPFLLRLGARVTVGMKTPDAAPLDRWIPYIYFQHEVIRYLEVASLVGATGMMLEPIVSLREEDLDEARSLVPETKQPIVALHPGAGDPRRRWPTEHFAVVGKALAAAGAHVTIIGTKGEQKLVDAVVNDIQGNAQDLCAKTSLGGLAGLLSRCCVLVSNDSGPLHLAGAVGAATVGIYWCFNLVNASPVTRLYHRPFVSWRITCPVCTIDYSRDSCEHRAAIVAEIEPEEVTLAALNLFFMKTSMSR